MPNPICWLCGINLVYKEYDGAKLLDESGSKPCFDCITEDEEYTQKEDWHDHE